jgi:hypothetical protein
MSGIMLPMVHTTNTITPSDAVGIDQVMDIASVDAVATGSGGGAEYKIIFVMNAGGGQSPREVSWRYATSVLRDADLALLLTKVSSIL